MEGKPYRSRAKGMIALPVSDLARYHAFTFSLACLNMPPQTAINMVRSMDVTSSLNQIIREMLDTKSQWLWIMGDDHSFGPDTLLDLLDRDVDVVTPLCVKRNPPFKLVSFKDEEIRYAERDDMLYPHYTFMEMEDLPIDGGLMKIHAVGSAGMLVRRHVLEAIDDPWFENSTGTVINDDLEFCRKIRNAGFDIHLDCDTVIGHIGNITVFPSRRDGRWGLTIDFGGPGTNLIFVGTGMEVEAAAGVAA